MRHAATLLPKSAKIELDVSHLFLDHLLATNEVRVAITVSARQHGYKITQWVDDTTLKSPQMKDSVTLTSPEGKQSHASMVPDGYFVLEAGEYVYHHFLEVDRATETASSSSWGRRDWARKVAAYLEYYRSGQYEARYHTTGLRILTVTTGEKRLSHLKEVTERAGGKSRFWFTTLDAVKTADVLTDPIWQVASKSSLHALIW